VNGEHDGRLRLHFRKGADACEVRSEIVVLLRRRPFGMTTAQILSHYGTAHSHLIRRVIRYLHEDRVIQRPTNRKPWTLRDAAP